MVKAVAVLRGDSKVGGIVTFEQTEENQPVTVTYEIAGNSPNSKRGFHVHAFGDNTNGCTSAGPHFNPFNSEHGAAENAKDKRHVGDLGNITTDASGVAKGQLTDSLIQLSGQNSIIGRSVVVHEGEDDYGLGGHDDSKTTGHAGGRAACGVIGLTTN